MFQKKGGAPLICGAQNAVLLRGMERELQPQPFSLVLKDAQASESDVDQGKPHPTPPPGISGSPALPRPAQWWLGAAQPAQVFSVLC